MANPQVEHDLDISESPSPGQGQDGDYQPSLASTLPDPVLECLFLFADAQTFASLIVLNRHYRRVSDLKRFYVYHLIDYCAFFDITFARQELQNKELGYLKREFAHLAKREPFPAYRPSILTLELQAPELVPSLQNITEHPTLRTFFSADATRLIIVGGPYGTHLYALDLTAVEPLMTHGLNLRVKPDLVEISNDGNTVATVESGNIVSVYSFQQAQCVHLKHLEATQPVNSIALTPDGTVLSAVGESGIALFSTQDNEASIPRHVSNGNRVNHISFANDGTVLCGIQTLANGDTSLFIRVLDLPAKADRASLNDVLTVWLQRPIHELDEETMIHRSRSVFKDDRMHDSSFLNCVDILRFKQSREARSATAGERSEVSSNRASNAPVPMSSTADRELRATIEHDGQSIRIDSFDHDGNDECTRSYLERQEGEGVIEQVKWLTPAASKGASHQRLAVLGTVSKITNSRQPALSLTVLDFDYHVQCSERHVAVDLAAVPLQTLSNSDVTDEKLNSGPHDHEKLNGAQQDSRSSDISSLTYNSFQGHSTVSSESRTSTSDEQEKPQSLLPLGDPWDGSAPSLVATQPARSRSAPLDAGLLAHGDTEATRNEQIQNVSPPQPDVDSQTPRSDLPRHMKSLRGPHQSPNGLPLATASTPDLLMQSQTASDPVPRRPNQGRVRSTYDAARNSIMFSGKHMRRVFSGPLEVPEGDEARQEESSPPPITARKLRQRPQSMALPSSSAETPPPRPRSILPRPLSWSSNTILSSTPATTEGNPRIKGRRYTSQPLDRPSTPLSQIIIPSPYDQESPTLPSPAQVLSLHRRQTSGSMCSVHIRTRSLSGSNDPSAISNHASGSDGTAAPRAALGAYRRNTGTMPVSPWASTTMLSRGGDSVGRNRRYSMPLNAADGNGNITTNGRSLSAPLLENPRPDPTMTTNGHANGNGVLTPRTRGTPSGQPPPARLQKTSLSSTPSNPGSPPTENGNGIQKQTSNEDKPAPPVPAKDPREAKRSSRLLKAGRLSTVQSVASLMGASQSSSNSGAQTDEKARAQTLPATGTQQAAAGATEDKSRPVLEDVTNTRAGPETQRGGSKKSLWGKVMRKVMDNLKRV